MRLQSALQPTLSRAGTVGLDQIPFGLLGRAGAGAGSGAGAGAGAGVDWESTVYVWQLPTGRIARMLSGFEARPHLQAMRASPLSQQVPPGQLFQQTWSRQHVLVAALHVTFVGPVPQVCVQLNFSNLTAPQLAAGAAP